MWDASECSVLFSGFAPRAPPDRSRERGWPEYPTDLTAPLRLCRATAAACRHDRFSILLTCNVAYLSAPCVSTSSEVPIYGSLPIQGSA